MNKMEELLFNLEERCSMRITAPASKEQLNRIKDKYPIVFGFLSGLYELSDGIEINVPGTVLYGIDQVINSNKNIKSQDIKVGYLNFGDELVIDENGKLLQVDHETGEVFLEWDTIIEFLNEELDSLV